MKKSHLLSSLFYPPLAPALFTAAVLFCITACNSFYTKDNYLNDFEQFVTQVETEYIHYIPQDWENADSEYEQYTSELYQKVYSELSSEDQRQIGKLKVRYEKVKLKSDIKGTIQSIKDGVDQVVGAIEEVIDSVNFE